MKRLFLVSLFIGIALLHFNCSENNPSAPELKQSDQVTNTLAKKMPPAQNIVLADNRFEALVFYDGIMRVDGIVSLTNSKLLVVNESGDPGIFRIKKGHTFDINDAFSTIGAPFVSPDDITRDSDGTVYVADGQAQTVFKLSENGGAPQAFITTSTTRLSFNPFGVAIAPANFNGPNVDPGDIIVADNADGSNDKAVWAVNPNSGVARIIAQGSVFVNAPIRVDFDSEGILYINQNTVPDFGRIVTLGADGTVSLVFDSIYAGPSFAIHPITDEIFFKRVEGKIYRMPKTGGTPQLFASIIGRFQDIAFNAEGTALYFGDRDEHQVVQISANIAIWD